VEVTLPRFLFVREARYYFNNGREGGGRQKTCTPNRFGSICLANSPRKLPGFTFQNCPWQDSHPHLTAFETVASALGYMGENALGRDCTDTDMGLSHAPLRWATRAKRATIQTCTEPPLFTEQAHRYQCFGGEIGYRTWTRTKISQIQSLWSYFGRSGN
jgi:hypothetical protein